MNCDPIRLFESIRPSEYEDEAVIDLYFEMRHRLGEYQSVHERLVSSTRILDDVDPDGHAAFYHVGGDRFELSRAGLEAEVDRLEREIDAAEAAMRRLEDEYRDRFK